MGLIYDLIFSVFALTGLAAVLGNYIDKRFHTFPLFAVTLGISAIIFGLGRIVIKSKELYKNEGKDEQRNK